MKPATGWLLLALVGVAAGLAGFRLSATRVPAAATRPTAAATNAGQAATGAALAEPERKVPTSLPDIEMPDLAGRMHRLSEYRGHPLLLNFWATWCEPCRREIPLLRTLPSRYRADGLRVVGVAIDFPDQVREYLQHTPIDYPLLVGEDAGMDAIASFGMEPVLPFSVFADGQGQVVMLKLGELHADDVEAIVAAMRRLRSGEIDRSQARQQIDDRLRELATQRALAHS